MKHEKPRQVPASKPAPVPPRRSHPWRNGPPIGAGGRPRQKSPYDLIS